ncbi:hypothetical protein, partial [Burkholderia vietnamiensis]|uniref:hypothetical protein n=1 Tax=Burkholderia vietnamiensis TaxID=60552 RepID=UPI001B946816
QYAHRDHLCIPCSKIEQGIQSRGSKFDENYSLRWVSSAWTSTGDAKRRTVDPFADLVSSGVEIVVLMALLRHGVGALRCI